MNMEDMEKTRQQRGLPETPEQRLAQIPNCAHWNLWVGREVEGTVDVGTPTLFCRNFPINREGNTPEAKLNWLYAQAVKAAKLPTIKRIWFCKEWRDELVVLAAIKAGWDVCVEMDLKFRSSWSYPSIMLNARIYFKLPIILKPGDFLCVGRAYRDEAFQIGGGVPVTPQLYGSDIFVA